jgi:hypothetical protein
MEEKQVASMTLADWPRKPMNGVCCCCNFSGEEETTCPSRADGIHCVHWWEGSDGDVGKAEQDGVGR